jgi:hypothetical protein
MVNQTRYRPGQAHRIPGGWGFQVWKKTMKVVMLSTFTPQELFLVLISVRGWVNARVIGPEECHWKIPMKPSGFFLYYWLRLFRVKYVVLVFDEGLRAVDFSIMKNPTASVGSEPAIFKRPARKPLDHRIIEPATFRLVAQCPKQLRHRVPNSFQAAHYSTGRRSRGHWQEVCFVK